VPEYRSWLAATSDVGEPSRARTRPSRLFHGSRATLVKRPWGLLAGLAIPLITFGIYLPVIVVPYATADDFDSLAAGHGFFENLWHDSFQNGRPLGGVLEFPAFTFAPDIASLRLVRLVSVAGIALLGLLLYRALRRSHMNRWVSTAAVISIISLPSFQVYAAWTTAFISSYAAILAGLSSLVATAALDARFRGAALRLAASSALLFSALLTYQQMAMFFWVFAAIAILRPGQRLARSGRLLALHVLVAIPTMAVDYSVFKILTHYYGVSNPERASLVHDVPAKLRWFIDQPLVNSLNLFALTPTRTLAVGVAALGIAGILLLHLGKGRKSFGFLLIAAILVPLSYIPNLATSENWASYRSLGALSALFAVYAWFGLWGIARAARRVEVRSRAELLATRLAVVGLAAVTSFLLLAVVLAPLWHFPSVTSGVYWSSSQWLAALALLFATFAWVGLWATGRSALGFDTRSTTVRAAIGIGYFAAAAGALTGALVAARNVTTLFAKPLSAELTMLRTGLSREGSGATRRVAVIMPGSWQGAAPLVRYDEFGIPSTSQPWCPQPAVVMLLREEHRLGHGLVVHRLPPTTTRLPQRELVVDMRRLQDLRDGWTVWTLRAG